ncbi:MAG TPA: tripartite tricarboxylate transporter substrate binding protein [Burkholderiales bacterium]|nr:tripartite tricarboxylate transporter substrate binding protein [Burkholderiales bacterium]
MKLASFLLALALSFPAAAQDYPTKTVHIIASAAGGLTDLLPRTLAAKMQEKTGQPWIVEQKLGAGGVIGAEYVMKSPPDGYTLFVGFTGVFSVLPALGAKLPFDVNRDFQPIILMATVPNILVVNPSVPANSVRELIELAKSKPGKLTYASQGVGSSGHITGEQFKQAAGVDILHVPYKGAGPAIQDLLGGQVDMLFDVVPLALANIRGGKVRALGVATKQRVAVLPDVPTLGEAGVPGMEGGAWFALYAPAGTPAPVVEFINREANRIFSEGDIRNRLEAQGVALPLGTPEDLRSFVQQRTETWARVARLAGIKLEP